MIGENKSYIRACLLLLALLFLPACVGDHEPICTGPADFANVTPQSVFGSDRGPVETVITEINLNMRVAAERLYNVIIDNGFPRLFSAVLLLYIVLFGMMVALGMVELKLGDALVRLAKIGFIYAMVSPGGFDFFFNIAGDFFILGTDQLINEIVLRMRVFSNALGELDHSSVQRFLNAGGAEDGGSSYDIAARAPAFRVLDLVIMQLFSEPAIHFYLACLVNIPYGWFYLVILLMGILFYLPAVASAVWIYLIANIAKTLLLAVAPIFVTFILFQHTRPYFDSWLRNLILFSLQPILMFTFLAMYSIMIDVALNSAFASGENLLACLTPHRFILIDIWWWEFAVETDAGAVMLGTTWTPVGPRGTLTEYGIGAFPMELGDLFVFVVLAWIAWKFQPIVELIAQELSTVYAGLSRVDTHNPLASAKNWGRAPKRLAGGTARFARNVIRGKV